MEKTISAAVLAGGLNSRMDYKDKSMLTYNGASFLINILSQLESFDKKMIISNNPKKYFNTVDAEVYSDIHKKIGPLGGIHTALIHSATHNIFITSCDMPLIKKANIDLVCSFHDCDIVMPVLNGKFEMLFALYSKNCLPQIERLIGRGKYKITGLLEDKSLKVKKIPIDREFKITLQNINTKEDYNALKEKSR